MKPVPIATLRPGTLCHFIDTLPGDEKRINYYRIAKNRKARPSVVLNGALVVPIMAYGYEQCQKSTFKLKQPSHSWIDGRCPVYRRTKQSWLPKGVRKRKSKRSTVGDSK